MKSSYSRNYYFNCILHIQCSHYIARTHKRIDTYHSCGRCGPIIAFQITDPSTARFEVPFYPDPIDDENDVYVQLGEGLEYSVKLAKHDFGFQVIRKGGQIV